MARTSIHLRPAHALVDMGGSRTARCLASFRQGILNTTRLNQHTHPCTVHTQYRQRYSPSLQGTLHNLYCCRWELCVLDTCSRYLLYQHNLLDRGRSDHLVYLAGDQPHTADNYHQSRFQSWHIESLRRLPPTSPVRRRHRCRSQSRSSTEQKFRTRN